MSDKTLMRPSGEKKSSQSRTEKLRSHRWGVLLQGEDADSGNGREAAVVGQEDGAPGEERGGELEGIRCLEGVCCPELSGHPADGPRDFDEMEATASREEGFVPLSQDGIADPVGLDECFKKGHA